MSLSPGPLLVGSSRIVAPLGFGGQTAFTSDLGCHRDKSEPSVHRAHDTRLDRDVAIKLLPEAFAADREPSSAAVWKLLSAM